MTIPRAGLAVFAALLTLSASGAPTFAATAVQAASAASSAPVAVSTCSAKSAAPFAQVSSDYATLLPSVRKQIAAFGLRAKLTGCSASVACVAKDPSPEAMKAARAQCSVVTRALVISYGRSIAAPTELKHYHSPTTDMTRANAVRATISKIAVKPGGPYIAGMVYVYLK